MLVATPGRLIAHLEKGSLLLDNTDAIVMDEVDVLAGKVIIAITDTLPGAYYVDAVHLSLL